MSGQAVWAPPRWPLVGRGEELEIAADALSAGGAQGILVCGAAGVGKTRLAVECLAAEQRRGRAVGRATATAAAATVPLGALVPLLPPGTGRLDPVVLFDRAATAFRMRARGEPLLLMVDDLHLLDVTSTVLLGQLLDAGVVALLGTLRTNEPMPPEVAGWWHGDRMVRIDLGDLSADGLDSLLHLALGGPVTAATVGHIWAASRGNPLLARELVLGAQTAGSLVVDSGVWRLTGPLRATTRLTELIETRLHMAGASAAPLLEILALVEPVGLADLEAVAGVATVEALERAGLIDVRPERRRYPVTLSHPLYGDVLRARMPVSTRRRLLLAHAARVERHGARRREDPLRIAIWRLDATGTAEPAVLLRAARLARYSYDLAQAARLARAALAELGGGPDRVEARLLLGEALAELGDYAAADDELAEAEAAATDEDQLVQVIAIRARTLLWGLLRPDAAIEVIRAARARVTSPKAAQELLADESTVLMFSGHPAEALAVLEGLDADLDARLRAVRAIPEASALVSAGRCESALGVARRGYADHSGLVEQLAIAHPGTHLMSQSYALQEAGRIAEATALATAGFQVAIRTAPRSAGSGSRSTSAAARCSPGNRRPGADGWPRRGLCVVSTGCVDPIASRSARSPS